METNNQSGLLSRLRTFWPEIVYGLLLTVILCFAAALRFRIPQTPIMDADSWGYLNPGFSKLTGGYFQHTFGRNFVYPGFVFVALCGWGHFEGLTVAQHLLGLMTGVLLAFTWNVLCGFLPGSKRLHVGARFCGLLLVADYLFSRPPLILEHTIRPEAVFPFFLALSFLLNLTALQAWLVTTRPRLAGWCFGANLVVTYVAVSLKPSMGFGAAAANLPLLLWLWRGGVPWREKAVAVGAALAVIVPVLWLPEHQLAQRDTTSVLFLPTMLFTINAPAIHAQIVDDLRRGDTAPYQPEWLGEVNRVLERSMEGAAKPENGVWRVLGFNADYLIYRDPVFDPFFGRGKEREEAAFCLHYYRRAWQRRTGEMFAKVTRQLAFVYAFRPQRIGRLWRIADGYTGQVQRPMSFDYKGTAVCTQNPGLAQRLLASRYGAAYVRRVHSLQRTKAVFRQYPWVGYLNNLLNLLNLPLLIAGMAAGAALLWRGRETNALLVGTVWFCAGVNFAMFLTVAVAHTLEIERYVDNQRLLTLFTEFASLLLCAQCCLSWRRQVTPAHATP